MLKRNMIRLYTTAAATLTVLGNKAMAQDASTGFVWFRGQTETQASAAVQAALMLAFAYGVVAVIIAAVNLRKFGKDQLPDDKKNATWFFAISGALATVIPLVLAFTTGVFGGAESAAEAVDIDWGL